MTLGWLCEHLTKAKSLEFLKVCPSKFWKKSIDGGSLILIWLVVRFTFINYRVLWPFWKVCLFVYIDYSLHRYSGVKITVLIMFVLFQLHWLQFVCIDVDGKIAIKNVIWNFVIFLWGRSLIWYFATQFVKKWFVRDETIFILFSS